MLPPSLQSFGEMLSPGSLEFLLKKRAEHHHIVEFSRYLDDLYQHPKELRIVQDILAQALIPFELPVAFGNRIKPFFPWLESQRRKHVSFQVFVMGPENMAALLQWLICLDQYSRTQDSPLTYFVSFQPNFVTPSVESAFRFLWAERALTALSPEMRDRWFDAWAPGLYQLRPAFAARIMPYDPDIKPLLADARALPPALVNWPPAVSFGICTPDVSLPSGQYWLDASLGLVHLAVEPAPTPGVSTADQSEYFTMIDRAPYPMLLYQDGLIVMANAAAQEVIGATQLADIAGMPVLHLVHPNEQAAVSSRLQDLIGETGKSPLRKGRFLRLNGEEIYAEVGGVRVQYQGRPAAQLMFRDITKALEMEARHQQLTHELEARVKLRTEALAQSNEDLERFAYSVSHDLRAPLRHLISFTGLLRHKLQDLTPDQMDYLVHIESGALKMNGMIEGLLDFSRIGRASLVPVWLDTAEVVREVLSDLQIAQYYPGTTLTIGELPSAWADVIQFELIWSNLLSNAFKYSRDAAKPEVRIEGHQEDGWVSFQVWDNGVGFPPERKDELFEVFKRLVSETDFPGLGIGLSHVKRIIQRHEGRIEGHSIPGQETRFSFSLPLPTAPAP